ncbi:hypothetical protein E2C01_025093 [Portunus trituberculatus]|uniref:Uncharacterized protein n=1 Tax=Portunus trituberculatus TaxID=210409 RepID=A0A5B7EEN7_PORTR|nr:hypothetical protein [Portunus trituberculatus]
MNIHHDFFIKEHGQVGGTRRGGGVTVDDVWLTDLLCDCQCVICAARVIRGQLPSKALPPGGSEGAMELIQTPKVTVMIARCGQERENESVPLSAVTTLSPALSVCKS